MAFDVDLFVIGAGSGGVRAARIAADYGAQVMIAEEFRIGGTCVIRGCVPKKLIVYASRFADEFEDAAGYRLERRRNQFRRGAAWSPPRRRRSAASPALIAPISNARTSPSSKSGRGSKGRRRCAWRAAAW